MSSRRKERLIDHAVGAYVGMAVGDSLGASVEFMTPREITLQYGVHQDIIGGGWLHLKPGDVTDDTQMSLALGRAILMEETVLAKTVCEEFCAWMSTKPKDIGHTVRRGLKDYLKTGAVERAENDQDAGNGAVMRQVPLALFSAGMTEREIQKLSRLQAHTTHHARQSDLACEAVLKMVHLGLEGDAGLKDLQGVAEALCQTDPDFRFDQKPMENPSGYVVDTMKAVFQSLFETDSFEKALIHVVNKGGDADTTGAILGMIAGAFYGLEGIPQRWFDALIPSIRTLCIDQAQALIHRCPLFHSLP